MDRFLNDWFVVTQDDLIEGKLSMVRFLNKDMATMLQLKDKITDPETIFLIDEMIKDFRIYVQHLGKSIESNRRFIRERKERRRRISDSVIDRNEGRTGSEAGTGESAIQQHSFT